MNSFASSRIVNVARPRKSNFTRPIDSTSSLSNWLTALSLPGCMVQRAEVGDAAGRDQHAARVHADVARHAFEPHRERQQLGDFFVGLLALLELGRFLARVDHARLRLLGHAAPASRVLPGGAGISFAMLSTWP